MGATREIAGPVTGFAAGVAAQYFLDPRNGKRRRHVVRDRGLALVRRPTVKAMRLTRRKASYAGGMVRGAAHRATHHEEARDPARLNDAALAAKVESEIFRDRSAPKGAVDVNAEAGVVYLRGELGSDDEARLVAAAEQVNGVAGVRSLIHAPGEAMQPKETAPTVPAA